MQADDETTAVELKRKLEAIGIKLFLSTMLRCRRALGWIYRGPAYCQLIRVETMSCSPENSLIVCSGETLFGSELVEDDEHRRFPRPGLLKILCFRF